MDFGKSGGVYIPPFKMARLRATVGKDDRRMQQRLFWDALRKSINGLINKVSTYLSRCVRDIGGIHNCHREHICNLSVPLYLSLYVCVFNKVVIGTFNFTILTRDVTQHNTTQHNTTHTHIYTHATHARQQQNQVNTSNLKNIIMELFGENIVRGKGLLVRSVMKAQMASPNFTHVYAALVAVVNTKMPEICELLLKRVVMQFKRAFKRNDKVYVGSANCVVYVREGVRLCDIILSLFSLCSLCSFLLSRT